MKSTLPIQDAIAQVETALDRALANLEASKTLFAEARDQWVTEQVRRAWFNKSRRHWEHRFDHGSIDNPFPDKIDCPEFIQMSVWEDNVLFLNTLLVRLKKMRTWTAQVTLDEKDLKAINAS